ncbi:hypothetical protein BJ165DRAFT_1531813 [Panaeolus papilionaceus]|nr:hypothetical protein BJ165DRAFT_1531813 [Panaeolus papilionaceus]
MGRTSKYTTNEERMQARKQRRQEQARTDTGKELRRTQNRRSYERRRNFPSQLRLRYQDIPAFIRRLGEESMNITTQSLFEEHYYSTEPISPDDDFEHWESIPPYFVSKSLLELGFTDTVDAVHGRRLRIQHDREQDLVNRYNEENHVEMWCEVHLHIFRLIGESKTLRKQLDEIKQVDASCVHYIMGRHFLFWKAKAILSYSEYWKIMRTGSIKDVRSHFEAIWYD